MQEYPKALYFGTVQAHQHKVVNGFEHENELRELGFVDFADLKEYEEIFQVKGKELVETVDYSSMTSEQLRKILDEKGIKYLARDNKETLIELAIKGLD
ncbi:hypothetical protein KTH73_04100 [Acinetobacter courvalinii]|uniref:hypothetical protein n=1 Tax=Acinetobacter courvalinii TaxID=280147 RepID=UPI0021CD79A7|nr:hypothetical protein [Acinetobacter courvalinii]MCU4389909.1 hypothetical protein [Acinetobacter courvalinii]